MALASDRATSSRHLTVLNLAMAAAVLAYSGALAVIDATGHVKPGVAGVGLRGIGRFKDRVDNSSGAAGDLMADIELGVFQFDNSANADAITDADIGKPCYVVDDHTVARTHNGNQRSVAGIVADVDADGVWVDFTRNASAGAGKVFLTMPTLDLKAADNGVSRLRSPVAGRITAIGGVNGTAVTGADATVQAKINGVNVTTGLLTWPLAGAAAGQVQAAYPTANNVVAVGDVISLNTGGGGTQTGNADINLEITL